MTTDEGQTVAVDPSPNHSYCWDRSSYDNSSIFSDYSGDPVEEKSNERKDLLGSELPRQDGGRRAWTVLIAGFVIQAIIWGEHSFHLFYSLSY